MSANLVREVSVKEKGIDVLQDVFQSRRPCLIHGVDIGPAQSLWTAEYLATKCGARAVKVLLLLYLLPPPRGEYRVNGKSSQEDVERLGQESSAGFTKIR